MEELLNKLIELDRQARARIEEAENARSLLLEEIEKKKKKLVEKNEADFQQALEPHRLAIRRQRLMQFYPCHVLRPP